MMEIHRHITEIWWDITLRLRLPDLVSLARAWLVLAIVLHDILNKHFSFSLKAPRFCLNEADTRNVHWTTYIARNVCDRADDRCTIMTKNSCVCGNVPRKLCETSSLA